MEELEYANGKEPKVRTKISRLSKGTYTFEATTRGETVEESIELLRKAKEELEKLCQ